MVMIYGYKNVLLELKSSYILRGNVELRTYIKFILQNALYNNLYQY